MLQSARTTYAISAEAIADSTLSSANLRKITILRGETGPVRSEALHRDILREAETMLDRRGGYEYEDLLACGRGELFGPGNAQLPLPPMLMFDRISQISATGGEYGRGLIRAELDVKPDLWFFGCHFKGDPVMPGCLGLHAVLQMDCLFLGLSRGDGPRPGARPRPRPPFRAGDAE